MRLRVDIEFDRDEIPKDKNRIFISLFKAILKATDEKTYHKLYDKSSTERKEFTFSLNMPKCKFNRETISVPGKKISLFFTTSDLKLGISFYNAFMIFKCKKITYKDLSLQIIKIYIIEEKAIKSDSMILKTASPIVIRNHNKTTNKDWYYDFNDKEGYDLFLESLKRQIIESIPESVFDLDELTVEILTNRPVKVKHYGIEILANLAKLKINAKPYILDYILNSGVSSLKSSGFGMLTVV